MTVRIKRIKDLHITTTYQEITPTQQADIEKCLEDKQYFSRFLDLEALLEYNVSQDKLLDVLHFISFSKRNLVKIQGKTLSQSKKAIKIIRDILERLPFYLRHDFLKNTASHIILNNGVNIFTPDIIPDCINYPDYENSETIVLYLK